MTWQVLNALYDPIAQRYANQFLLENGVAGDTPQTLRTSLEGRLNSGNIHRRYNILDAAVATEYGIAAANVPAQESRGRRFLQSLNPLRAYNFFNENDKQQVTRAVAEIYRQHQALNNEEDLEAIRYLAPQEVGNIVDRLVESKTARAAARQIAINANYTAALNEDGSRSLYRPEPQTPHREDFDAKNEDDGQGSSSRPNVITPFDHDIIVNPLSKLHALDCRSGYQNSESWEYSDVYNLARSIKPGETTKTLVRDIAILGSAFATSGITAATLGAAGAAWIGYKATSALVGAGMQATMNYAQRYTEDRDAAHALGATAGVWAMYGINAGKEAAQCETVEGMGTYLATVAALVTGSEATHYVSKKTDNRFVKGTATAVSGALDWALLALLGFGRPDGTAQEKTCENSDAPTIDMTLQSEQNGSVLKTGDTLNYTVNVDDKPNFGDAIKDVNVAINRPDGSVVSEHLYANEHLDKVHAFFGDSHTTDKGSFEANTTGDYKMTITASDTQGHTTEKSYDFAVTEQGATPVHPHEPGESDTTEPGVCDPDEPQTPGALEDCVKERFTYGKDIHKGVELREVYNYHNTPLKPEAGHEQGLTLDHWKSGSVSLNNVYDEHTPCDFNVDNTVVMLEHYTDAKALDYRVLVDVDASGHFEIPKEFAAYKGDDIQVTWASVTHCEDGKLGLEDLASYTHGKHVVIPDEAVFSGTVPAHVAPQYVDCDGTAAVTPAPKHSDVPTDDCGPCAKPCDQEYYVPVGVIDSKAGPCPEGTPVMSSNAFVPAGTLDSVVNTFGYMPSDVSAASVGPVPGSLDTAVNPFGYTPDAATPVDAPAGTLDQHVNPFDGVAPETLAPTGVPEETRTPDINPYNLDDEDATITYNLGQYYEETCYIDDEVLRAFERQQQAALELRLA